MNRLKAYKYFPRTFAPWSEEEDRKILELYVEGKTLREIGAATQRHQKVIKERLESLRAT